MIEIISHKTHKGLGNTLRHEAIVKIEKSKAEEFAIETAKKVGYHPAGFDCFDIDVKIEAKWTSYENCE